MQEKAELQYADMKAFLSFFVERYLKVEGLPVEKQPISALEELEKKSMKSAFTGLRQSINDCIEMSARFDCKKVKDLDDELRGIGVVTLSELRRQHSRKYANIMKRGFIKNDTEYYLARNIFDDHTNKNQEERDLLGKVISDYDGT